MTTKRDNVLRVKSAYRRLEGTRLFTSFSRVTVDSRGPGDTYLTWGTPGLGLIASNFSPPAEIIH